MSSSQNNVTNATGTHAAIAAAYTKCTPGTAIAATPNATHAAAPIPNTHRHRQLHGRPNNATHDGLSSTIAIPSHAPIRADAPAVAIEPPDSALVSVSSNVRTTGR